MPKNYQTFNYSISIGPISATGTIRAKDKREAKRRADTLATAMKRDRMNLRNITPIIEVEAAKNTTG